MDDGGSGGIPDIFQLFSSEEDLNILSSTICLEYTNENIGKIIEDISKAIRKNKLQQRKTEITELLAKGNSEDASLLEKELSDILIEIKKI